MDKTNATSESAKKKKKHKKKKESEQKEGPLDPQSTQNDNGTPLNEGKDKTPSKQHKVKKHSETENVAVGEPNGKQEKSRKKVYSNCSFNNIINLKKLYIISYLVGCIKHLVNKF